MEIQNIKIKKIFLILAIIAVSAGIFFVLKNKGVDNGENEITNLKNVEVEQDGISMSLSNVSQRERYTSPSGDFSFSSISDFTVSRITEDERGETLLFKGGSERESFQIFISPFDSGEEITAQKIKNDIPEIDLRGPQAISIDGVVAIAFLSSEGSLETREIWFARSGKLYQISTYTDFDVQMAEILEGWKWLASLEN